MSVRVCESVLLCQSKDTDGQTAAWTEGTEAPRLKAIEEPRHWLIGPPPPTRMAAPQTGMCGNLQVSHGGGLMDTLGRGGGNLGGLKPQEMLRLRCSGGVRWMSEVEEEKEGEEMQVNEEIHQMWL